MDSCQDLSESSIQSHRPTPQVLSDAVRRLVAIAPEELAELESAASALERVGLEERAGTLRDFATKVRATLRTESLALLEAELEALVQAEGLAMRAGPRPRLDAGLLSALREAITTCRLVEFRYLAQSTGLQSHQRVKPLGLLYGNRAFLVASSEWKEEPRLWRLANVSELRISEETFERDPDFDLERYAKRSFGTFQEEPVEVVLRFAPGAARDASNFVFHPEQATEPTGGAPTLPRPESNERRARRNGTSRMPPALSGCHGVSRPSSQPQVDGACVAATRVD